MNTDGGALHFDIDIAEAKALAKIAKMEQRIDLFSTNAVNSIGKIDVAFSNLGAGLAGGRFSQNMSAMQAGFRQNLDAANRSNSAIGDSFDRLGARVSGGPLNAGLNTAQVNMSSLGRIAVNGNNAAANSFTELAGTATQAGNQMSAVYSNLTGVIAGFLSIQAASNFVQQVIKIRTEFENLDVAFTTMLKSKEKADTLMAQVVEFAATTPFGLQETAKATKQLLAYGVAAEDIKEELTSLGNVAAGVSQPVGEIAYLYGTLKTQGRAYAMDIRQFTGRGIPIIAELAKVFGVAKDEVMGLVEEGKVGFPEVQKAFQNMTGSAGQFYDLMQKQSLTTGGRISNLKDNIDQMLNSFGASNAGIINLGITGISSLVDNYKNVIDVMTVLIATYGTYRAALVFTAALNKQITVSEQVFNGARMVTVTTTRAMTGAEAIRAIGLGISTKAQLIYNAALAAAPMALAVGAVVALGAAIYSLTQANNTAADAQKRIGEIQKVATEKRAAEVVKIKEYIDLARDASLSDEQRAKAVKKLNDLNPEFLSGLNSANIVTAEGTKIINEYLRALEKRALGEAAYAQMSENNRKIIELNSRGPEGMDNSEFFGSATKTILKNLFDQGKGVGEFSNLINSKVKDLEDANKRIKEQYGEQIKISQLGEADSGDAVKKNSLRTEAYVKAQIKKNEELRAQYALNSKEYARYTGIINKLNEELKNAQGKLSTGQSQEINQRLAALDAISKAETRANQKSLSETQEKIQKERDAANQLRDIAKKAKLGPQALTRIDEIERKNVGTVVYEQETDAMLKEIGRQKEIFQNYEDFKKRTSASAADERFKTELIKFKNFTELLSSEITPLQEKTSSGAATGAEQDRLTKLLLERQKFNDQIRQDRDKEFTEALIASESFEDTIQKIKLKYANMAIALGKDATNSRKNSLLQERDVEINAAKDAAFQKTAIYKKLSEDIIFYTKEQAEQQSRSLMDMLGKGEIPNEFVPNIQKQLDKLNFVLKVGSDQASLTRLQEQAQTLKEALSAKDENGNSIISPEEARRILADLERINAEMKDIDSNGDGVVSYADKLKKNFEYLGKDAKGVAQGVSGDLGSLSSGFGELSTALGGSDTQAGYLVGTIADLAKVGADAAGAVASFASGDIIGGITKTISAVAGVFSIGKKVKEMNEKARAEVQAFYDKAKQGEIEYMTLLRDRERKLLEINAIGMQGQKDQIKGLKDQKAEIDKNYAATLKRIQESEQQITSMEYKHGTWFRKAATTYSYAGLQGLDYDSLEKLFSQGKLTEGATKLFEELRKLKEEGADVTEALKEAAKASAELATGTTVENLSSKIISDLRAGKTGLKDVMDDYTAIIQDALLSVFESEVVKTEMKGFYDKLAAFMEDGLLTKDEESALQQDYIERRKRVEEQQKALEAITGVKLSQTEAAKTNLIGASIQSLSEDTGSAIEGIIRNLYEISKANSSVNSVNSITLGKQVELMMQAIGIQLEIRDNTGAIAKNTADQIERMDDMIEKLTGIVTNTSPGTPVTASPLDFNIKGF